MKVKLLCGRVGDGFSQKAGDVVEVGKEEGRRMIDAWQAEPAVTGVPVAQAEKLRPANKAD